MSANGAMSAQRLSASEVLARGPGSGLLSSPDVLNAFRHLRFSHTIIPPPIVIMAECSTPFGI